MTVTVQLEAGRRGVARPGEGAGPGGGAGEEVVKELLQEAARVSPLGRGSSLSPGGSRSGFSFWKHPRVP